jgi:hypothetical protein
MQRFCNCRPCKKQRRRGRVLGSRLLRHFGSGANEMAYFVSCYVKHRKFIKGRARKEKFVLEIAQ